jgi:Carboxypeptidase regulatory-like domain/TonB dependent receptor
MGGVSMRRLFLAVVMILTLGVAANAQTFRGAINGTVTDPSGSSVPNATVKATETATGIDHTTVTTSDGGFAFQDIPLGQYKVTITATGFPPYTVDKVEVSAGTIYTLNVKLTLQSSTTTVEVSAAAITLDTTTATQNMTITSDVVQDVPLNGRDFTQLIAVAPGYGGYSVGGFGSMNGARTNQNNWQIDGVDNNDFWHNIPAVNQGGVSGIAGVVLPIDAIDEFSSQTQAGAESGRNAGGTVNLVIKSGGNDIHGSAYYYNRNEFYGAPSPFLPSGSKNPPLRNQNYGFSVGGPVVKNKLFYFASYEKQQYIIGLSGVATEPSDAWIGQAVDLLNNPGGKYGSYAPVTPSSLSCASPSASGCSGGLMGPSGFWPRSLIGGLAGTNNNFFSPVASTGYSYNGVGKVDYQINDKHHLYARFFGGQGSQTAPLGGSPALGTASSNLKDYFEVAPLHVFNESLVLNSTFSSRLTNQILVGANYFNQVFHDFNNSFDTKAMGLFLSPGATNKGQPIFGAPNVQIGNFEQIGLTPPEGRSDLTWHITDIVSYSMGAHQLRFGGEFRRGRVNEFYHRRGTGKFVFDGTQGDQTQCTANPLFAGCAWGSTDPALCNATCQNLDPNTRALADFLAGSVSTSSIAVGNPERTVHVNALNFYFQDSWQLNKKLSINYGMRYEYFGPLHSSDKDLAVFIPNKGLVIQGAGIGDIFPPDRNNFAPRLGFAYQAKDDMVVRGSFGVFYDQININPFLDFRPPANAADGLQDNPIGPHPVSNYSLSGYNWQGVQAGGASIFPDVKTCTTLNFATDPNCVSPTTKFAAYAVNQNFRTPYFYNYSLQVEKSLGHASVIQLGYVGSEGRKLNIMTNINPLDANGIGPLSGQYPNAGNILQENSIGTSNYNALQAMYRLRLWHGLTSTVGYTWSHSLDEISQYRATVADSPNIKVDYGNSDNDTRHLFTTSISYDVPKAPWAHGWSNYLVNGWQVSSLWNFHTGQPWNVTLPFQNLVGDPFKSDANFTVNHSFTRNIIQSGQPAGPGVQWVNPDAFAAAPTGSFGNLARNKYYGPGFGDVDLSVFKNIPIRERLKIQLRAEMFNLLNRVNFASGPGAVNSDGTVRDTIGDFNGAPGIGPGEAFNMQLAIKVIF